MYDIFYVSKANGNDTDWNKIKSAYPIAQRLTNITSYDQIRSKSFTKMFWVIWDDVDLDINFNLTNYRVTKWDDMYVHVFKNGEHYDGICLFPKSLSITQREFYHRFFVAKKEIDQIASTPKNFNIYSPRTFEEYQQIEDEMFWIVWPETVIVNNEVFKIYFSHHNNYDRRENHVFKNLCDNNESYLSGAILCSKYKPLSNKEFDKQYAVDKKEHDLVATKFQYPIYNLNSYDQYLNIIQGENQKMFWGVWPEIEITDKSIFDFYFDPNTKEYDYDRSINHVFKHRSFGSETFVNGLTLFSKNSKVNKREFNHRFIVNKKEHDRLVSQFKHYDIIFISYNEPNADENYTKLKSKFSRVKRVDQVKGIHNAHKKAAELSDTDMFWVVDGDAEVLDNFSFDFEVPKYDKDAVFVWKSRNPINDLEYGYGGVKLFPKNLTLNMDINSADMTTSISKKFKPMADVSNITVFNTDPFNTWKSAFRECVKLSSKTIDNQVDAETESRLDTWCNVGKDKQFGEYAVLGAMMGKEYGEKHRSDTEQLSKINDFNWLRQIFETIKEK